MVRSFPRNSFSFFFSFYDRNFVALDSFLSLSPLFWWVKMRKIYGMGDLKRIFVYFQRTRYAFRTLLPEVCILYVCGLCRYVYLLHWKWKWMLHRLRKLDFHRFFFFLKFLILLDRVVREITFRRDSFKLKEVCIRFSLFIFVYLFRW